MKKIKFLSFIFCVAVLFSQCTKIESNIAADAALGGLVEASTKSVNYVVGDAGPYSFDMSVMQNADFDVNQVRIFKSAVVRNAEGVNETTNEVLAGTIDVPGTDAVTVAAPQYTYADLIEGLTLNGEALPASDGDLSIGDKFVFRIVSDLASGSSFQQSYTVDMTVSTRFAGTYVCTAMQYWRIGVASPSYWLGDEIVIKSIDAITYQYDFGATIGWTGPLYFQVDGDGNITYPVEWNGAAVVLNGQPLITCADNIADLANVPCDGSNVVIKDDVDGKDQLILTYGYFTGGSGPREFHETLVKK